MPGCIFKVSLLGAPTSLKLPSLKETRIVADATTGMPWLLTTTSSLIKGGLLGYIHKMPLAAKLWNVTPEELEAAKEEYTLLKTDPLAGKRVLNKSNFMREVFAYAHTNFPLDIPEVDVSVLQALRSGEYAASSIWLAGSGAAGIDLERAKRYWRVTQQPDSATIQDVHAIFFHNPYAKKPNILPQRVPSYDELRQRALSQHVAMTEHHYARGHVVLDDEDDSSMDLDKQPGPHHFNARGPSLDQESPSPSPAHESLDPSHGGNDLIDDQALQMD